MFDIQFILSLEQIGAIIAVISIIVGIILGLQSARDWSKSRNIDMFLQYQLSAFTSEFIQTALEIITQWQWDNAETFWKKYGSPEAFAKFMSVGTVFDSMGVLLAKKYIPVQMIPELLIGLVRDFWLKMSPIASQIGMDVRRPDTFRNIEYLFNEIQKMDEVQEPKNKDS